MGIVVLTLLLEVMETTETLSYKVKTAVFEGPLELLLSLIESRKLFINEISLSEVTDDYVSYIRTLNERSLSDVTGFISIAATLILIKSRSLLPGIPLTQDEEKSIVDLESRLRMYQVIKEVSEDIKTIFGKRLLFTAPEKRVISFEKAEFILKELAESDSEDIEVLNHLATVLAMQRKFQVAYELYKKIQSLTGDTEEILYTLAHLASELSLQEEVYAYSKSYLKQYPKNPEILWLYSQSQISK